LELGATPISRAARELPGRSAGRHVVFGVWGQIGAWLPRPVAVIANPGNQFRAENTILPCQNSSDFTVPGNLEDS
jgi:hypothetical protein